MKQYCTTTPIDFSEIRGATGGIESYVIRMLTPHGVSENGTPSAESEPRI